MSPSDLRGCTAFAEVCSFTTKHTTIGVLRDPDMSSQRKEQLMADFDDPCGSLAFVNGCVNAFMRVFI